MKLQVKTLRNGVLPQYGRAGDAAFDLQAAIDQPLTLKPGERAKIGSGVAMAIPAGHVGLVFPRSGLGSRGLTLMNGTGVIDSNYRGEIFLTLVNTGVETFTINPLDRILQMTIIPVPALTIEAATELEETNRGASGFGSSGT